MTRLVRESYDTLALIESGREIFGGGETPTININTETQSTPKRTAGYRKINTKKYGMR